MILKPEARISRREESPAIEARSRFDFRASGFLRSFEFRISDFGGRVLAITMAGLLLCAPARADRVDDAAARAVGFLVAQQDRAGAFVDKEHAGVNEVAMTALAVMAIASVGHQPADRTREGEALRRAVDLLTQTDPQGRDREGYLGVRDGSRMYGHGIATLALTEMLGMGMDKQQDRMVRERCQKAVELILRSQRVKKFDKKFEGGWRYSPDSGDSDLSITVWQVMALRSAKNAGFTVPKEAIDFAVAYLKRSYDQRPDKFGQYTRAKGACAYQPGTAAKYSTAAAGLLALQVCGHYDAPETLGSTAWLHEHPVSLEDKWFFYGTYYYSQGMQKRGGEIAARAKQRTEQLLLANQQEDGSWIGHDTQEYSAGRVYCTSLALLSLSVKYHFLPIYQH